MMQNVILGHPPLLPQGNPSNHMRSNTNRPLIRRAGRQAKRHKCQVGVAVFADTAVRPLTISRFVDKGMHGTAGYGRRPHPPARAQLNNDAFLTFREEDHISWAVLRPFWDSRPSQSEVLGQEGLNLSSCSRMRQQRGVWRGQGNAAPHIWWHGGGGLGLG